MKEVTVNWLKSQDACGEQVELFENTFGQYAKITKRNLLKAASSGLHIDWLAGRCLKGKALRAYEEAIAPASRAYNEACAPASRAYNEVRAPARRAYEEAIAPASRAYNEACASALWNALKLQQKGE